MWWKLLLSCLSYLCIYFLSWCIWLGIWRTVAGTWSGEPTNSSSCIFTAYLQRSVWIVLCIRRLTLIHLSSVLRKFSKVHLKHLHSHSPEAFWFPWSRVSLESSYLNFTSAKDLASDSGNFQHLLMQGQIFKRNQPLPWIWTLAVVCAFSLECREN